MSTHFKHLWLLGQKSIVQIFERRPGYKIRSKTCKGSLIFSVLALYIYLVVNPFQTFRNMPGIHIRLKRNGTLTDIPSSKCSGRTVGI